MKYKSKITGYKLKTVIVSIGVVLFVAIVGVKFIYQPTKEKISAIESIQKEEEEKNKLLKQVSKRRKDVQRRRLRLSKNKNASYFINQITKLADESGIEIISIKPGLFQREDYYQKLPLVLEAKATYNQLGEFISKLESSRQFILVEEMNLRKEEGKIGSSDAIKVRASLTASLFCSPR